MPGNNSIRCLIVEDEPLAREIISRYVLQVPTLQLAGACANAIQAFTFLQEHAVDLVFLDIRMPQLNGNDFLKTLQNPPKVIFTTAYDHYALPAIKFAAIDFLLKPLSIEETKAAVDKVLQQSQAERLDQLVKYPGNGKLKRLALPTLEGFAFIDLYDLVFLAAEGSYTVLHMADGQKHIVSKPLKEYDEMLEMQGFFRIHHSHIVHLDKIVKYIKGNGGYVVMTNGLPLDVSARRKEEFIRKLMLHG